MGDSILTGTYRDYLRGEKTYDRPSVERGTRSRMRQRIRDGVIDFTDLFEHLSAEDREQIFRGDRPRTKAEEAQQQFSGERDLLDGSVDAGARPGFYDPDENLVRTNTELEQGLIDGVAFFYTAAYDAGLNPRSLIEHGVERAERKMMDDRWMIHDVALDVDKDVQHTLAKNALANMKEGEDLSNAGLRALLESGRGNVTAEQIQAYVAGEWEPDESDALDPASGV